MGKVAFFWGCLVRIICSACARRSVPDVPDDAGNIGSTSWGSWLAGHRGNPPKSARYALGIDHEGARIKSHPRGMLSAEYFRLEG